MSGHRSVNTVQDTKNTGICGRDRTEIGLATESIEDLRHHFGAFLAGDRTEIGFSAETIYFVVFGDPISNLVPLGYL